MINKARNKFLWFSLLGIIITMLIVGFQYRKRVIRYVYKSYHPHRNNNTNRNYYTGPVSVPAGYSIHGIDVSRWQDEIDWSRVKSVSQGGDTLRFQFAFIKATEGTWKEDPMFVDNWKDAGKNKIIRGAYHYFLVNANPKSQACNFISSVTLGKGDLPPVVDIEEAKGKSKSEIVRRLKIFLTAVELNYQVKPIIYSNIKFIEKYLVDDFVGYNFWIAHYYKDQLRVDPSIKWIFWQHSDCAHIFGCRHPIDANVFNGGRGDLNRVLLK